MPAQAARADDPDLILSVTISGHARFVDTASALAAKAVEMGGCSADSARQVGRVVKEVMQQIVAQPGPREGAPEIRLEIVGRDGEVEVDVSYAMPGGRSQTLVRPEMPGPAGVMGPVEYRAENGRQHCFVTCRATDR